MQSMYRGRLRAALEPGNESVAIARREGLREQLAQSLTDVGRAHLYGPDLAAARAAVGEARLIWEELGNIPMICECLTIEGNARAFAGDFGACLELHKQAIELATRIGNEWSEMTAYVTLDLTFRTRGWFQRVLDETPRLLEKADRLGHPVGMMLRGERALTLMALGAYPQAIDQAQELVTLSEKYPRPFKPVGVTILTRLSIRVGDLGMARRYVGLGQDMAEIDTPFDFEMQRWMARIEFMAADGKEKEARRLADEYVSLLTSSGVEIGLGEAHVVAGLLASESGDDGEAASHALEGLTVAERIGARDAEWRLLALLARVDPDNAADHRAIARAVVGALAADLTDHRLRATFEEMAMGEIERGYPSSRPGIGATTR
jgi:tetratricopeptide (TPR) repeat protein